MVDTAFDKVQDAIALQIKTAMPTWTVAKDRSDDEPFAESELPAINIFVGSDVMDSDLSQGQVVHTVNFDFDILTRNSESVSAARAGRQGAGLVVAAIHADRSIGGRLHWIEETAIDPNSKSGLDIGAPTLSMVATFITPLGDLFTIVGQSGVHF